MVKLTKIVAIGSTTGQRHTFELSIGSNGELVLTPSGETEWPPIPRFAEAARPAGRAILSQEPR